MVRAEQPAAKQQTQWSISGDPVSPQDEIGRSELPLRKSAARARTPNRVFVDPDVGLCHVFRFELPFRRFP